MPTNYPLIAGPYQPPRCRVGRELYDIIRGDLMVTSISDAPIAWPCGKTHQVARPLPVMTAELVRAVRTESVEAIVYHWGVSRWTVRRWRHALGVPRFNPGTMKIWREAVRGKFTPEVRARALSSCLARKKELRNAH
jgi:hypothetical protein